VQQAKRDGRQILEQRLSANPQGFSEIFPLATEVGTAEDDEGVGSESPVPERVRG